MGFEQIVLPYYVENESLIPMNNIFYWGMAESVIIDSNQLIMQITDESGKGNHALQTVESKRATIVANHLNGKPTIRFNGYSCYNLPLFTSSTVSFFTVFKKDALNSKGVLFADGASGSISGIFDWDNKDLYFNTLGSNNALAAGGLTNFTILEIVYSNILQQVYLYINGTLIRIRSCTGTFIADSVGFWKYATAYLSGNIAEMIVYSDFKSEQERIKIENYLKSKYGIL